MNPLRRLKKSISEMSEEEALDLIRERRASRHTKKEKPIRRPKKEKDILSGLTDEQKEQLLKMIRKGNIRTEGDNENVRKT